MSTAGDGNGAGRDTRAGARPGRRALFSDPTEAPLTAPGPAAADRGAERAGRRAFFSDPVVTDEPAAGDPHSGRGPVVVCRTCLARTPVSLISLGLALVPSLWLPTRPWSRLMRCPACHRVSWCRLEWTEP